MSSGRKKEQEILFLGEESGMQAPKYSFSPTLYFLNGGRSGLLGHQQVCEKAGSKTHFMSR